MTTPTTSTPRRINADVFRRARREGATLDLAAYVARPPVLDLTWLDHYQSDETWADFTLNGRKFRASYVDPRAVEGTCIGCAELVQAWRDRDENIAWMTDEEYDRTDHRALTVTLLDEDEQPTGTDASLWGVCGRTDTYVDRLADERYLADTVAELAAEAVHLIEREDADRAARVAARKAERVAKVDELMTIARRYVLDHTEDRARLLATVWADDVPRSAKVAGTYFALLGQSTGAGRRFDHASLMADAERVTPTD